MYPPEARSARSQNALGLIAAGWGLTGAAALLARAIWSLGKQALSMSADSLAPWQWALTAAWVLAMCFFQGYLGFQRGFSSRVVLRARHLARQPQPHIAIVLLAPLYCIGLVGTSRRRLLTSWSVVGIMVLLVIAVSRIDQPYRGLVDTGVAAGLVWGLLALGVFTMRAVFGNPPEASVELEE